MILISLTVNYKLIYIFIILNGSYLKSIISYNYNKYRMDKILK